MHCIFWHKLAAVSEPNLNWLEHSHPKYVGLEFEMLVLLSLKKIQSFFFSSLYILSKHTCILGVPCNITGNLKISPGLKLKQPIQPKSNLK